MYFLSNLSSGLQIYVDCGYNIMGCPIHKRGLLGISYLQENEADQLAVDAMRKALNSIDIEGTVVIGEGERG